MLGFNGGLIGATRITTGQASVPGIWTPREQLRARRESLWPVVVTYVDPYASSVSLYLKGDGPNASTTFIDSSPAPKTVTAVGNAQISTAQSKFGGASMLFAGGGDYLSISSPPSDIIDWYSTNYTLEYYLYANSFGSNSNGNSNVLGNSSAFDSSEYWSFGPISGGTVRFYFWSGTQNSLSTTTALSTGIWYHLAFVKNSTSLKIYINGVESASTTLSVSPQSSSVFPFVVGKLTSTGGFNGYIDDFRITKGVARYTANFTPTYDADPYASSTVLLLKGDGVNGSTTFVDGSPSPKAITAVGNAQISTTQSKFGGASMLFDGSGDYVEVSSNTAFEFGTGDFTIELWFYMSTLPATFALFSGCAGRNFYFGIGTYSGNRYLISYDGSAELNQVSGTSITAGTWYHAAHCRSGGTARLFLNGNEVRSGSFGSITGTTGYQVGASPFYAQYYFNGYIDDFRITKGVARYTSNFTPPGAL